MGKSFQRSFNVPNSLLRSEQAILDWANNPRVIAAIKKDANNRRRARRARESEQQQRQHQSVLDESPTVPEIALNLAGSSDFWHKTRQLLKVLVSIRAARIASEGEEHHVGKRLKAWNRILTD